MNVGQIVQEKLDYKYLGNWEERENNSNIERELLQKYLNGKYDQNLINKAINQLEKAATNQTKSFYDINKEIYGFLRYGISVKENVRDKKTDCPIHQLERTRKKRLLHC